MYNTVIVIVVHNKYPDNNPLKGQDVLISFPDLTLYQSSCEKYC